MDPTLCHWGGPSGTQTERANGVVVHFGHGQDWGQDPETQGRAGVTRAGGWAPGHFTFTGLVGAGDSGSPIRMAEGNAAGVITHTSNLAWPHFGTQYANRVDSGLARANAANPGRAFAVVPSPTGNLPLDPDVV